MELRRTQIPESKLAVMLRGRGSRACYVDATVVSMQLSKNLSLVRLEVDSGPFDHHGVLVTRAVRSFFS